MCIRNVLRSVPFTSHNRHYERRAWICEKAVTEFDCRDIRICSAMTAYPRFSFVIFVTVCDTVLFLKVAAEWLAL
jgi:hypothetical protein